MSVIYFGSSNSAIDARCCVDAVSLKTKELDLIERVAEI